MRQQYMPSLSRRGFITAAGIAAAAAWLGPRRLFADEAAAAAERGVVQSFRASAAGANISVESLRGNLTMVIGSGGNIAVLSGKDGKFLVDAGMAGSQPKINTALASISHDPIEHVVNTHWHFDHTDGNEWLNAAGAEIAAHPNTLKRMSENTRVEAWDFTFPPSPKGALPTVLVEKELIKDLNGEKVVIRAYGPCHTDTDLSIFFTKANILHTGDTFWNGHYPFIDYSTGGDINNMIRATERNLANSERDTIIIPGHGPIADRSDLTAYRDVLVDVRDKVAAMKKAGKSLEEIIASKPGAEYDAAWGSFVIDPPTFVKLVYAGV